MLTDRLRPERTYKPTQQTRNLDALERGHWFVKFNLGSKEQKRQKQHKQGNQKEEDQIWPHASFETFWKFLNDFIAKDGRAGWGVWCILERSPTPSERTSTNPSNADMAESIDDSASVPVSLKIYAWGEIAMHIYLLLFLASERRIRGMGAQWRDAGEHIVLQMP
jgi:hypothetical protein